MTLALDCGAHWLEQALACAEEEGLGANFARWVRFLGVGPGEWLELQALGIKSSYGERARFAHADSGELAVRLLGEAERFGAEGLFCIPSRINPAVATRREPRRWHDMQKGASTSDRDILARRALFVDIDAVRPSGTSASAEELAATVPVALAIHERLGAILERDGALGYGHSGNGRQVYVALGALPESEGLHTTIKGVLAALGRLYSTDRAEVDAGVADPKRLVPAFGTTKRKGASGIAERPHRRTAFVCADESHAIDRDDLERIFAELRGELDAEGKQAIDRAMGIRPNIRPAAAAPTTGGAERPFDRANAVPIEQVASFLGLLDGAQPRCPGCGHTQGVTFIANGLKCLHKSCADKGAPGAAGFRSGVDLVSEARGIEPRDAVNLLAEQFGFEGFRVQTQGSGDGPKPRRTRKLKAAPSERTKRARMERADGADDRRPVIVLSTEEPEIIDRAEEVLASSSAPLFQRAGSLVRVLSDESPLAGVVRARGSPHIRPVPLPHLRELLAGALVWQKWDGKGKDAELVRCHPPDWVTKGLDARGKWARLRHLEAVVEAPVVRPDGTVVQEPGYDQATGLLYLPSGEYEPVAERPSQDEARAACEALLEAVCDFPFESEAHKATWLAGVLSPFARYAYRGPTPLFLVDANVRGAGKSKLVDVISEIASGRPIARYSQVEDEAEERKRITSIVLAGHPIVLVDNLTRPLGSGALDSALTAEFWSDRALGKNEDIRAPLITIWYATGNNIQLVGDTSRRCAHIRLQSPEEKPEARVDFRHPDLLGWVRLERGRLATAATTVLRAYFVAGAPDQRLRPWGSFEGWSRLVRQAIVWCGYADPGDAREELAQLSDREADAAAGLIAGWAELQRVHGAMTVAQALQHLADAPSCFETLRSSLAELLTVPAGKLPSARSVGLKIHHLRDRIINGAAFERVKHSKGGVVWRVRAAADATEGDALEPPPPPAVEPPGPEPLFEDLL